MRSIGIAVRVLLVIALVGLGLPAAVQAQGGDEGLIYNSDFEIIDPSDSSNPDGWTLQVGGRNYLGTSLYKNVENEYYYSGSHSIRFSLDGYSNQYAYGIIKSPLINTVQGDLCWYQYQITSFDGSDIEYTIKFYDENNNLVSSTLYYTDSTTPSSQDYPKDNDMNPPAVIAEEGGPTYGDGDWYKFSTEIPTIDTNKFYFEISIYQWEGPNKVGDGDMHGSVYYGGFDDFYIGKQTGLTLTKSASPHSIKQGQTTTVTLTVENTGTTELTDIEVSDTLPSDLIFVSGETSKRYESMRPKDSREFQYTLQPSNAGTFNLNPATATYADEDGNYHTSESSTVAIEVIPAIGTTPAPVSQTPPAVTALTITKSPSLNSIRQFGETTITISIENSGTTDATDIEITDAIHPSFDLTSGDFPNPKRYNLIRPGETRDLQYTIRAKESGTFTFDPATVTYADEDGNIQEATSEPVPIKVIPSTEGSTSGGTSRSNPSVTTASVQLHGEKTDVVLGENILLKLSAVNLITKPTMHVQVIIIPPSGMSVTSSAFAKSGAGQYTTTYELEPGSGKDIEVAILSNQVGTFDVNGRIIYYFGDDREAAEDHTLTLPITVRAEAGAERAASTSESEDKGSSAPGFAAVVAVIGLLAAYMNKRRM
jgi:uncharacterized repeat protein (TIGR01451 family)